MNLNEPRALAQREVLAERSAGGCNQFEDLDLRLGFLRTEFERGFEGFIGEDGACTGSFDPLDFVIPTGPRLGIGDHGPNAGGGSADDDGFAHARSTERGSSRVTVKCTRVMSASVAAAAGSSGNGAWLRRGDWAVGIEKRVVGDGDVAA